MFFLKVIAAVSSLALFAFQGGPLHQVHEVAAVQNGDGHSITMEIVAEGENREMTLDINGETLTPDISGMAIGDIRTFTTESGAEVAIERKDEHLYALNGGDGEIELLLNAGHEGGGEHQVFITNSANTMVFNPASSNNTVTISGLDNLDEAQKQRVIDALRAAGIEKDINFSTFQIHQIGGDSGMTWVSEDGEHDIKFEIKADGEQDKMGEKVIIMKRQDQ